jgi:hypothetical protein
MSDEAGDEHHKAQVVKINNRIANGEANEREALHLLWLGQELRDKTVIQQAREYLKRFDAKWINH